MVKFILPLGATVTRRRDAWSALQDIRSDYGFAPQRVKLREETFQQSTVFNLVGGGQLAVTRRAYTYTFHLSVEAASDLLAKLNTRIHKLARVLTQQSVLLCLEDNLAIKAD